MTRLFIENTAVDLLSDMEQLLTFNIDDIRRIDAKTTAFSRTITLPGTARNNRILGDIYELTSSYDPTGDINVGPEFDPSRSANARVEANGLLVMKGIMRLMTIRRTGTQIEYEVALFGELGGFMTAIGTKRLEDIDLTEYNHTWDFQNMSGTWNQGGQTITGVVAAGPFSSANYNPPITYIRFDVPGQTPWLQPGDNFEINGSTFNDGTYTAYDVIWVPAVPETRIIVQINPAQPFTGENAPGATLSKGEWGTGYVYPLIDYGQVEAPGFPAHHDYRHLRPAFFVKEYMRRIIAGAGYTWESGFFNTPFFNRLIIPNNDIALEKRTAGVFYLEAEDQNLNEAYSSGPNGYNATFGYQWSNIITTNNIGVISIPPGIQNRFRWLGTSTINVKIKVYLDIEASVPFGCGLQFRLRRIKNGTNTAEIIGLFDQLRSHSGRYTSTLEVTTSLDPGDFFDLTYTVVIGRLGNQTQGITVQSAATPTRITVEPDPPGFVQYQYGELLDMNTTIPKNVFQKDFFLSIVKMFNLMITEDPLREKHLRITPYVDFYNPDPSSYLDWTKKVARDKAMIQRPMSEANARVYDFKFKEDTDYHNEFYKKKWNEVYGNKTYDNQLEFSKDKAAVEVIFSPSVITGYDNEFKIFPSIYKYDEAAQQKTNTGHNIRIMQIKAFAEPEYAVAQWKVYNGPTAVGLADRYLYAGHLDDPYNPLMDINWGVVRQLFFQAPATGSLQNNLFFVFYSPYMAEIISKDSRLLTCETFLTEQDINNLDFSRLIWIDGALYRLMKIQDWTAGALNRAELLRVINTFYPPSVPVSARGFRMKWTSKSAADAWILGDASKVDDWNLFFGLTTFKFTAAFIDGQIITLLGTFQYWEMQGSKFKQCTNLLGLWDDIGAIYTIGKDEFASSGVREVRLSAIYKTNGNAAFENCQDLVKFEAPRIRAIANETFKDCWGLEYLDLRELAQPVGTGGFCGTDLTYNRVFENIFGNTITLHLSQLAYQQNDADFDYLFNNNTVLLQLY